MLGAKIFQDRHGQLMREGRRQRDFERAARRAAFFYDIGKRLVDTVETLCDNGEQMLARFGKDQLLGRRSKSGTPKKFSSTMT